VEWLIEVAPEVISSVKSFGFSERAENRILESLDGFLGKYGGDLSKERWPSCPDDYFVHNHILIDRNRLHSLTFIVKDSSAEYGVLKVAWVEHFAGGEFP
jgi:hypothetical protein